MKNLLIVVILFLLYVNKSNIGMGVQDSINLWINNLIPNIFPILIMSDLLLSSKIPYILTRLFGKIFNRLFKVNKYISYVFIMSMISGCPSNAKYLRDLYDNGIITCKEIEKVLSMTLLYNPLLIFSITGYLNIKDRLFLIIINVLINILIGIINRNYKVEIIDTKVLNNSFNLIKTIGNSINTLILILGVIITFNIINNILPIKHPLITGVLEITNGIKLISYSSLMYKYKLVFTGFLLSVGGFSIILQIKSIFKDTSIDYSLYYRSRIIHLLFMIISTYLYYSKTINWVTCFIIC